MRSLLIVALLSLVSGQARAQSPSPTPPSRTQALEAAFDIIQKARYATLVTIGADGHPQARIVDPFSPEEDLTIWIATNPRTRKVAEIERDSSVSLLYFNPAELEYVTVAGTAELISDPVEKAAHWKEEWAEFYKEKNRGPDYLLVRVVPTRLEVVSPSRGLSNDPDTWLPVIVQLR